MNETQVSQMGSLLTVERLPQLASRVDAAIARVAALGVTVHSGSRFPLISRLLRTTSAAGRYPNDRGALEVVGESIRDAQEFIEISAALPSTPVASVVETLRRAIKGGLTDSQSIGPHLRAQTELWVGAMMSGEGHRTGVLDRHASGEKNPDYILENGTLRYGVEVKRPNGSLDAANIVKKAASQIRSPAFHGGVLVIDLTDCLEPSGRLQFGHGTARDRTVPANMLSMIQQIHEQIYAEQSRRLRPGREHVFSLVCFARRTYWNEKYRQYPELSRYVQTLEYWRRSVGTLRFHRGRWLGGLLHHGILQSGHRENETPLPG